MAQLFSVRPAVCCAYLNSREYITLALGPIGSSWSNWLTASPGNSAPHGNIILISSQPVFIYSV